MRIARAMLMVEPASIDGNELTDKGYINQRAGLERRAALVERLYADHAGRRRDCAAMSRSAPSRTKFNPPSLNPSKTP